MAVVEGKKTELYAVYADGKIIAYIVAVDEEEAIRKAVKLWSPKATLDTHALTAKIADIGSLRI